MTIDESDEFWKGTEFPDVVAYLVALEPGGYQIDRVIEARCECGGTSFHVNVDRDDELAQTQCVHCGAKTFVADSEDHWDASVIERQTCPCGGQVFEVGLGLCIREDKVDGDWVRWGSVGSRCLACGILASAIDWKSDLALTNERAKCVARRGIEHIAR
ncbi:MAG: hypothetical protein HYV09_10975 [Deltaproteobacteria bacterium]|nr:hypothetical protein [Deltaproteobacteria bacterium]